MRRWLGFLSCALASLVVIVCGLQVPAHLRAVDAMVLQTAGQNTPSLVDRGLTLASSNELGAAQLLLAAARAAWISNSTELAEAVDALANQQPALNIPGRMEPGTAGTLIASGLHSPETNRPPSAFCAEPFTDFIVRSANRTRALQLLETSPEPLVGALLQLRALTNTVLFPPSSSTSGQALDAAIAIGGLLAESDHLTVGMITEATTLATQARRNGDSAQVEQLLMDLMSLGQRFNWGQLAGFVAHFQDAESLRVLGDYVRRGEGVPEIYAAVCLSGDAAGVARYLTEFGRTGLGDLRASLVFGTGGLDELLQRRQQLCDSSFCRQVGSAGWLSPAAIFSLQSPSAALAVKWLLYLFGGFLAAAAFHYARRVTPLERPLQVRGVHLAREFLFALGFLLVVLLWSEPFLAQENQPAPPPFRLRLPTVGSLAPAGNPGAPTNIMNQITFLTMLLFFVLQALLYVASLVKLAEIRRQRVSSRMKLKLLENEDHLFDAGLYLGFLGTIISLILVSLGVFKQPSLMAAYSSTSFGILFVVLFKVVHLRGARRQLLMLAETEAPRPVATPAETTLAAPL